MLAFLMTKSAGLSALATEMISSGCKRPPVSIYEVKYERPPMTIFRNYYKKASIKRNNRNDPNKNVSALFALLWIHHLHGIGAHHAQMVAVFYDNEVFIFGRNHWNRFIAVRIHKHTVIS
jgi:hypothetical protein